MQALGLSKSFIVAYVGPRLRFNFIILLTPRLNSMKRLFSLLVVAMLISVAARAQVQLVTVSPEGSVTQLNDTVTFTFSESVNVNVAVLMGGAGFSQGYAEAVPIVTSGTQIKVAVSEADWGAPYQGNYQLIVWLPEIYQGSTLLEFDEDVMTVLTCEDDFPARFLYATPEPASWTAQGVYDIGEVDFVFTDSVNISHATASVVGMTAMDVSVNYPVANDSISISLDDETGLYVVRVRIQSANVNEDDIANLTVTLDSVLVNEVYRSYQVTYTDDPYSLMNVGAQRKYIVGDRPTAVSSLNVRDDKENVVYTLSGKAVKKNLYSLSKGLYIVNGKKTLVK